VKAVIVPAQYEAFVESIAQSVERARLLGLFRTAERLHEALREARSETFEAMPRNVAEIVFTIGPVESKTLKPKTR